MARTLLQASVLVSIALLIGRLSGLVREQSIATRLGLGQDTDAIVLLLTLPDVVVNVLLAGGLSAALVPVLSRAHPDHRVALLRRIVVWAGGISLILAILLVTMQGVVTRLLAPSLEVGGLQNFQLGFALSMLALPISVVVGPCAAYLQVIGRNSLPPLGVLVFNGTLIAYFLLIMSGAGSAGLVDFLVFGSVLVIAAMLRLSFLVFGMSETLRPAPKRIKFPSGFVLLFIQGVAAQGLVATSPIIFRSFHAAGGAGELATFSFAERLFHLPVALLISPVILLFLPLLSRFAHGREDDFRARTFLAVETVYAATFSAALVMIVFAVPITDLLFGYGQMRDGGTDNIADVLQVFAVALPAAALFQVASTSLNARTLTNRVFYCSIAALVSALVIFFAMRQAGLASQLASSWGFSLFHVAAAGFACFSAWTANELKDIAGRLAKISLRCLLTILPVVVFVYFSEFQGDTWFNLSLVLATTVLLMITNYRVFLNLRSIRMDGEVSR